MRTLPAGWTRKRPGSSFSSSICAQVLLARIIISLISLIDDTAEPLYQNSDAELFAALRDFDAAYTAYADFQRQMEAYWSLVYLQQQGTSELTATILKEDLVRIEGLPLVTRATGIPFDALPKSQVLLKITELDPEKQFIALNYVKAVAPAVA